MTLSDNRHLYNYFHGIDFPTSLLHPNGTAIVTDGDTLLNDMFDVKFQDDYYMKWVMLVIGFAFAIGFRLQHYMLVYMSTAKLGASLPTALKLKSARRSVTSIDVTPAEVDAIEMEMLAERGGGEKQLHTAAAAEPMADLGVSKKSSAGSGFITLV